MLFIPHKKGNLNTTLRPADRGRGSRRKMSQTLSGPQQLKVSGSSDTTLETGLGGAD